MSAGNGKAPVPPTTAQAIIAMLLGTIDLACDVIGGQPTVDDISQLRQALERARRVARWDGKDRFHECACGHVFKCPEPATCSAAVKVPACSKCETRAPVSPEPNKPRKRVSTRGRRS